MNHTIIMGSIRTGSSLMVRLLTHMGADTGYSLAHVDSNLDKNVVEWTIRGQNARAERMPYVIKRPNLGTDLADRIQKWDWQIDHAYILVRNIDHIVDSRIRRTNRGAAQPDWDRTANRWSSNIGYALVSVEELDIPYTVIKFPKYARDVDYAYNKLWYMTGKYNISYDKFCNIYTKCIDPTKIHF
jgi:hypothetical protein